MARMLKKRGPRHRFWRHMTLRSYPYVRDVYRGIVRRIREIWSRKFDSRNTSPEEMFNIIMAELVRFVRSERASINNKVLLVLTPFMYRKFVEKFIRIIKRYLSDFKVVVVTRDKRLVTNKDEHVSSVELLRKNGIYVCQIREERFHAKAIIIGSKYVLAGSINILAPSYNEFAIGIPIEKLLENPLSARTILRIFNLKCSE